jgi:GNAT superfamily N-acetyltransferase
VADAFRVEPLGAAHDRAGFSCGVEVLDRYLRERATQYIKRCVSNCFAACDVTGTIAAYYTFAAASFPLANLPPEVAKRLPRCALLPAGLIGRLAVDQRFRGQRLGSALVIDAARRAAGADPAVFALVVDAKDAAAAAFYEHLGFRRFVSRQMSLFLPIATAMKGAQAAEAKPRFPVIRGTASTDMSTDEIMALRRERRRK